jgi:DMSO/TMAO reductase YedYZ molybdopterin-dependent catalytic subunit
MSYTKAVMDRNKALVATIAVIVLVASAVYVYQTNTVSRLTAVEVREYEGQNLSSINDFRENSIKGPQHLDVESYRLTVTGLVNTPLNLTYPELTTTYPLYEKVVTLHCVEGWDVTLLWEGVRVQDLLDTAQVDPTATVVIFYAQDGYSTSLPLAYLRDNDILMAYKMNGVILPPERGFPFQLVAESKWGYKWIKWITGIEVSDDVAYRGYWESRGYSNDADGP